MKVAKDDIISSRIRAARTKKGWSGRELGEKIGIRQGVISAYERGEKRPSLDTFVILVKVLGLSADYVLGLTDIQEDKQYGTVENEQTMLNTDEYITPKNQDVTIAGKIYRNGRALDSLAREVRDRLYLEYSDTPPDVLKDVKNVLHECLRLYEDNRELKHA